MPQFQKFFEDKYQLQANCTLCHLAGRSGLNDYGRGFVDNGLSAAAIDALAKMDLDKDGYSSAQEIAAGSNPGDSSSTPKNAGGWLKNPYPVRPDLKLLNSSFPDAERFTILRAVLPKEDLARFQGIAGAVIEDFDRYLFVILAKGSKGVLGGSSYAGVLEKDSRGAKLNVFLVSANPNGKIVRVEPVRVWRSIFKKSSFLKMFRDLWPDEINRIKLPAPIEPELAGVIKAQFAKCATQIDLAIGP
ncbi:MAG: hypothetical protein HY401_00015 [Elusimicrobia bacterium]|nr:hypothetical protein [Elusimicrobiota bacterium]